MKLMSVVVVETAVITPDVNNINKIRAHNNNNKKLRNQFDVHQCKLYITVISALLVLHL